MPHKIHLNGGSKGHYYIKVHKSKRYAIIGLFIDHTNQQLLDFLRLAQRQRLRHKKAVIKKVQQLGYEITFKEAASSVKGEIGRPHIAKVLVQKYPQQFPNVTAVFAQLLGEGKPAEIIQPASLLQDVINVIHGAGGVAILAHPGYYSKEKFNRLLSYFIECGGDGLEGYYFYDDQRYKFRKNIDTNAYFRTVAAQQSLLVAGGADYHGSIKTAHMEDGKVPAEVLKILEAKAKKYRT